MARQCKSSSSEENSCVCDICGKSFSRKFTLKQHLLIHEGNKKFRCDECEKMFLLKSHLTRHMKIHKNTGNYKCDKCDKNFSYEYALQRHVKTHERFICKVCGREFLQKYKRDKHLKIHERNATFKCDKCEKIFPYEYALRRHEKSHETFLCNVCGKHFQQKYNLNKHLKIHERKDTFQCDKCEKAFSYQYALQRHVKSHEKIACNVCGKEFLQKFKLDKHLKTHERIKKYKCDNCEQAFPSKQKWVQHVRKMHQSQKHTSIQNTPPVDDVSYNISKHVQYSKGKSALNVFSTHNFTPDEEVSKDLIVFLKESKSQLVQKIKEELSTKRGLKWYITVHVVLWRDSIEENTIEEDGIVTSHFRSKCALAFLSTDISNQVDDAIAKVMTSFEEFLSRGSFWVMDRILGMELSCAKYVGFN